MKNIPLILFLFLSFSGITAQKPAKIKKATRYVVVDGKNKKRLEIEYNKKRRETRWADFDEKTGDLISEVLKTYKGKRLLREVYRQYEDSGKVKIDSNFYYYNWLGKKTKKLSSHGTTEIYRYNFLGRLKDEIRKFSNDENSGGSRSHYTYSLRGRTIKKESYGTADFGPTANVHLNDKWTWKWRGGKMRQFTSQGRSGSNWSIAESNTYYFYKPFSKKLRNIREYSDTTLWHEYFFIYEKRKLKERIFNYYDHGKLNSSVRTIFQRNGWASEVLDYDANGTLERKEVLEYEYY